MNSDYFLSKLTHPPMLETRPQMAELMILTALATLFQKPDAKYQVQIQRLE